MSYTPTDWQSGDVITSTKLNKLEQGVANAGGALIIHTTDDPSTSVMDKTVREIIAAMPLAFLRSEETEGGVLTYLSDKVVTSVEYSDGYIVSVQDYGISYEAATLDDYPSGTI